MELKFSVCPIPDKNLKKEIDEKKQNLDILEIEINRPKKEIDKLLSEKRKEISRKN